MRSTIWCHLYNIKNVENTHGGQLLLVTRLFFEIVQMIRNRAKHLTWFWKVHSLKVSNGSLKKTDVTKYRRLKDYPWAFWNDQNFSSDSGSVISQIIQNTPDLSRAFYTLWEYQKLSIKNSPNCLNSNNHSFLRYKISYLFFAILPAKARRWIIWL